MALLFNPINIIKTASKIVMTASHYYVDGARYLWNAFVAMGPAFWSMPFVIMSLPLKFYVWIKYWHICIWLVARYIRLSWFW